MKYGLVMIWVIVIGPLMPFLVWQIPMPEGVYNTLMFCWAVFGCPVGWALLIRYFWPENTQERGL